MAHWASFGWSRNSGFGTPLGATADLPSSVLLRYVDSRSAATLAEVFTAHPHSLRRTLWAVELEHLWTFLQQL